MMKTAVFTSSLRHSFARSATAVTTTSCSRSKSPVVGICCRPQTQGRVRLFSSESPKPKEEGSAGGKIVAAVAGLGALYAGGQYLDQQKAEKKKELYQLVKPPAEVTSKCYLDIAIAGEPAGRIVIGLHGTITPKTVENFEAICKGDTKVNDGGWTKTKLTYEGSTFYNIIPTFAAMAGDIDGKGGRSIFDTKLFDGTQSICLKPLQ